MRRSLPVAAGLLAAVVLTARSSRAHWVETGFYECPSLANLTWNLPTPAPVTPTEDTLLVLENSSQSQPTCACIVLYDQHEKVLGAGLTDLSPQDNDSFDVCELASALQNVNLPWVQPPQTGVIEVVTVGGSCAKNGFAGTSKTGPTFSASTAAWTKFAIPVGAVACAANGGRACEGVPPAFFAFGPTELKVIDTTVNNGTTLAGICSKQGVSVDEHGPYNFCIEGSCPDQN